MIWEFVRRRPMRDIHSGVILVLLSFFVLPIQPACAKGKAASAGDSDITQLCGSQQRTTKQLLNCAKQVLGRTYAVLPGIAVPDIMPSDRPAPARTGQPQRAVSPVSAAGILGPTPFPSPAVIQLLISGKLPLAQCKSTLTQLQTAVTRNQRWLDEHNRQAAAQNLRAEAILKDIDAYKAACPRGYQQSAACATRAKALQARINKNDAEAEVINEEKKQLDAILPELIANQKVVKTATCAAKPKIKKTCDLISERPIKPPPGGRYKTECLYDCHDGYKPYDYVYGSTTTPAKCPKSLLDPRP